MTRRTTVKDMIGYKTEYLTVLERAETPEGIKDSNVHWKCLCVCGNITITSGKRIRTGRTKSCGCLLIESRKKLRSSTGQTATCYLYGQYKYGAKKRDLCFDLSMDEFQNIISKDCFYCGSKPTLLYSEKWNGGILRNGVDRLDNSKGYTIENCVSCCKDCNTMKMADSYSDFIERCKRIVERHKDGI